MELLEGLEIFLQDHIAAEIRSTAEPIIEKVRSGEYTERTQNAALALAVSIIPKSTFLPLEFDEENFIAHLNLPFATKDATSLGRLLRPYLQNIEVLGFEEKKVWKVMTVGHTRAGKTSLILF